MSKVVERILNLLAFLLTARRPVTADEIRVTVAGYDQDTDEAFRRMFERDKDLLRQMGIPIALQATDAWEVEQGYVIPPDQYQMPDPKLTDEERAALWLAAQVVRLGGQAPGTGAIFKLGGAPLAAAGEPLGADLGSAGAGLAVAFEAVRQRRRLRFGYRGETQVIAPYGLVHRRGHWYLVGAPSGGSPRPYRLDRAQGLEPASPPGAFARPKGFRLRDALASRPWEAGEEAYEATVRFDGEVAWWAERQLGDAGIVREDDGSITATMRVANREAFIGWLIAFEDKAEILAPEELRGAMLGRIGAET